MITKTHNENNTNRISRLAPSPTGALHLGNVRTFLINLALARQNHWYLIMRIEDLEGPRIKKHTIQEALDILQWLGLDWDGPIIKQSDDLSPYVQAMKSLAGKGMVYPCQLSRSEIEASAQAPHESNQRYIRFAKNIRPDKFPNIFDNHKVNWRFAVSDENLAFMDKFAGYQQYNAFDIGGDFVVWTKNNQPAYQLAVVVDDARQGVTDIIRGDDLIDSTIRQIQIINALDVKLHPDYYHLPLVYGYDGKRLAKRHGDTKISSYRQKGVSPHKIIGLIAYWSGITDIRQEMSVDEFLSRFNLSNVPINQPIIFSKEDDRWLKKET